MRARQLHDDAHVGRRERVRGCEFDDRFPGKSGGE
jgi:hypothetical protein